MSAPNTTETEVTNITVLLREHGYTLAAEQPHLLGERYLMQAVTTVGGFKYILKGTTTGGEPVIIKVSRDAVGRAEIEHERLCRSLINTLEFAYDVFAAPTEVAHFTTGIYLINIQAYIPQTISFLERPLLEQFNFALAAFKAQEGARATTGEHTTLISRTFGYKRAPDYLTLLREFIVVVSTQNSAAFALPEMTTALRELEQNQITIEQYGGFLTHTDFVPHNFRIHNDHLYLLDFSAIRFGNKHEGWARFLNFMTLYEPQLEHHLITYINQNRAPEERRSLQLMRLFRLCELITYYTKTLDRSEGDLLSLNEVRITYWHEVLKAELDNKRVSPTITSMYKTRRDELRSESEKIRQHGLH